MRSIVIIAAMAAAHLSSSAIAAEAQGTQVYEETSTPGESLDAFMTRVAPRALATTHKRDEALCGLIAKTDSDQFSLRMVSTGSPWKCTLDKSSLAPGAQWTGLVFRTHTLRADDEWTSSDMANPGYLVTEHKLTYRNKNIWRKLAEY